MPAIQAVHNKCPFSSFFAISFSINARGSCYSSRLPSKATLYNLLVKMLLLFNGVHVINQTSARLLPH